MNGYHRRANAPTSRGLLGSSKCTICSFQSKSQLGLIGFWMSVADEHCSGDWRGFQRAPLLDQEPN